MKYSWVNYYINPFFLLLSICAIYWILKKKKLNKYSIVFLIQTFILWFSFSFLSNNNIHNIFINTTTFNVFSHKLSTKWLILFGSISLYALFFIVFWYFKFHQYKWIKRYHFSLSSSCISIALLIALIKVSIISICIMSIFLGFALVIMLNGYYFYHKNSNSALKPLSTITTISPIIYLGLFGSYITCSFTNFLPFSDEINNETFKYILYTFLLLTMLISSIYFIIKPNINNVKFDFNIKNQKKLMQIEVKNIGVYLIIFSIIAFTFHLSSNITNIYELSYYNSLSGHAQKTFRSILSFAKSTKYLSIIFSSLILGRYFISKSGLKSLIIICLLTTFIIYLTLTFSQNIYLTIGLNVLLGFVYGIFLNILLFIALMWNERTKKEKFFLIVIAIELLVSFIAYYPIDIINKNNIIFRNIHDICNIYYCIVSILMLFCIVLVVLNKFNFLAEYQDVENILLPIIKDIYKEKVIIQKTIATKTKKALFKKKKK